MTDRSALIRTSLLAGAGLAIVGGLVGLWGFVVEPRLVQRRSITAWLPNLPACWEGQQIALLGDFQIGAPLANTDAVRHAIDQVIASRPAAALLAGDYVYNLAREPAAVAAEVRRLLRPLMAAGIPTFGVLGNHDFNLEDTPDPARQSQLAQLVETTLQTTGIRILRNQAALIPAPRPTSRAADALYVVGLGEHAVGQDDWRAAFRGLPTGAPRIVLAHDPAALQPIPAHWAPLALAGHTHGGQIRLPLKPSWTPARWSRPWPEYVDGWVRGFLQPGNHLYVNRGIGFSHLPMRLGAPPEVTLVTLRGRIF
jgi:predicted MPP superfamily phosphohydrolase